MAEQEETKIWASLGATINTGNFQNYKIDIGVTGIPTDISREELAVRIRNAQATLYDTVMGLAAELEKRILDAKGITDALNR